MPKDQTSASEATEKLNDADRLRVTHALAMVKSGLPEPFVPMLIRGVVFTATIRDGQMLLTWACAPRERAFGEYEDGIVDEVKAMFGVPDGAELTVPAFGVHMAAWAYPSPEASS